MKYLKYFKTDVDYQNYFNSGDFVTPNVSYVEDTNIVHYNPYDLIIMTSESNPEVMKVCYNQGWAASPSEMYASEAAKVTSIGTAFNGGRYGYDGLIKSTFSFDEFKYFTGVTSIVTNAFRLSKMVSITIPDSVTSIGSAAFENCSSLNEITCLATTAPSIMSATFKNIKQNGTLRYPSGSDYSSWMRTDDFYLGKYNWTKEGI